ncbi:uncharacterized protein LOC134686426 [Mytilus trossulus]|uniref:uncharacterized protein LOC134686426 n=1 Tax=Mytilus trossulus TaxID=6551 RepID=UPI003004A0E3
MVFCFISVISLLSSFIFEVTGLECYSCDDVHQISECKVSKVCDQADQVCITAENINANFQFSYKLGCARKEYCGQKNRNLRHICCTTNLCNKYNLNTTQSTTMVTKPQYTTTVRQITKQPATMQITQAPSTTKLTITVLPTTVRLQQTSPNNQCTGHGYHLWRAHCYFIIDLPEIWAGGNVGNHHLDPCQALNMHMVKINTDSEHNVIVNFVRNIYNYQGDVWLGGSYHQNTWMWKNSEETIDVHDKHWKPGHQHLHCLALHGHQWVTHHCNEKYKTVCEKVIK